ncbi:MAG: hypothetical protein WBL70_16725 [Candidatus Acidiferrales bacterium]
MVTLVPTGPKDAERLDKDGVTLKATPFDFTPPTVTSMLPLVAPAGTVQVMVVALQLDTEAAAPLNVTVEVP